MNRSDISLSVVRVPAAALALLTASTRHPGSVSAPRGPAGLGTHRVPGATRWSLLGAGLVSRMPECLLLSVTTQKQHLSWCSCCWSQPWVGQSWRAPGTRCHSGARSGHAVSARGLGPRGHLWRAGTRRQRRGAGLGGLHSG